MKRSGIVFFPLRSVLLAISGAICTGQGLWSVAHPTQLAAVNRAGLVYQRFGAQGGP